MVKSRYIGDGHRTFNRYPYNGYINPCYWVDDHPLLYGNNGSLDPGTYKNHVVSPLEVNHHLKKLCKFLFWLVVSTHLKNISQIGSFPQVGVNIKNIWNHHLVTNARLRSKKKVVDSLPPAFSKHDPLDLQGRIPWNTMSTHDFTLKPRRISSFFSRIFRYFSSCRGGGDQPPKGLVFHSIHMVYFRTFTIDLSQMYVEIYHTWMVWIWSSCIASALLPVRDDLLTGRCFFQHRLVSEESGLVSENPEV